jgi:hypothetical protein
MTMISILVIVLFFNIPFYNNWLNTNLLNPGMNPMEQSKHLGLDERRVARFGYSYMVYTDMANAFKSAKIDSPIVLLPPDGYLKKERITDISIVEPSIFYYFTGYKSVWYNSPDVEKANCALVPGPNRKMMLKKITDKNELDQLLAIYRQYKLDL